MFGSGKSVSLGLGLVVAVEIASASAVVRCRFGESGEEAAAFVVAGGREALTLGVAGWNLEEARLTGIPDSVTARVPDPVSRLVVFRFRESSGEGLMLSSKSPSAGVLREFGGNRSIAVVGRVERVDGRYLPFTLLRLRVEGRVPLPGSPLLDGGQRVAAVAHQAAGDGTFYAVPVEVLRRVLEDSRDGRVSKARVGIVLNPERGDLRVVRVVKGSPADHAGLRAGDVLQEIGGHRLVDYGDAVNALYLLLPGRGTRLRVRRGAGEVMLELVPRAADPS